LDFTIQQAFFFYNPAAPATFHEESRRGLSGDVNHDKAMKSRRYERAQFGPLPGYNKACWRNPAAFVIFKPAVTRFHE